MRRTVVGLLAAVAVLVAAAPAQGYLLQPTAKLAISALEPLAKDCSGTSPVNQRCRTDVTTDLGPIAALACDRFQLGRGMGSTCRIELTALGYHPEYGYTTYNVACTDFEGPDSYGGCAVVLPDGRRIGCSDGTFYGGTLQCGTLIIPLAPLPRPAG